MNRASCPRQFTNSFNSISSFILYYTQSNQLLLVIKIRSLIIIAQITIKFLHIVLNASKTEIIIYRITASTDISTSKTADLVQQIAIEEINNNETILPDYELKLQVLDSFSESEKALEHAIEKSQLFTQQCSLQNNSSSLISPIVLGINCVIQHLFNFK